MHKRMLFKIGVTLVLGVGIILFYLVNIQDIEKEEALKQSLFHETDNSNIRGDKHVMNMNMAAVDPHKKIDKIELNQKPIKVDDHLESRLKIQPAPKVEMLEPEEIKINQTPKPEAPRREVIDKTPKPKEMKVSKTSKTNVFSFKEQHLQPVFQGQSHKQTDRSTVHLCVVVCGERKEETMVMLKSAALVTPTAVSLTFHIVAEKASQKYFQDQLELWPLFHRQRLSYFIYNISFPDDDTSDSWKKLFKPCASQRLFLPEILQSVDSLIYVDTDTLFLRSLADLWSHFSQMNESQLAGVVSEAEDGTAGWYNRFANHPYYGPYGINSGVMLMNLTRMRQTSWLSDMQTFYNKYKMMIPWGDQDLINIYFAAHPDEVYLMSCPWNYRNDHCKYMSNCQAAEQEGVFVLHGSRRMFYENKEPVFAAVFETLKNNELSDAIDSRLVTNLERKLSKATPSNCGKVSYIFLTQLKKLLHNRDSSQLADKVTDADLVEEIRADMIDDQRNSREDSDDHLNQLDYEGDKPNVLDNQGDKASDKDSHNQVNNVNAVKESKNSANIQQNIDLAISNYQNDAYDYYESALAKTNLPSDK